MKKGIGLYKRILALETAKKFSMSDSTTLKVPGTLSYISPAPEHTGYVQEVIPDWTFENVKNKLYTFYKLMENIAQDSSLKPEHKTFLFKATLDANANDLIDWEKHRHEANTSYTVSNNSKEVTIYEN